MKVWIDQDLCTGDGLCEEIAPAVFTLLDDGLAYVKEGDDVKNEPGGWADEHWPRARLGSPTTSSGRCSAARSSLNVPRVRPPVRLRVARRGGPPAQGER